ncbi:putative transposase for insertion sequence NGRIS-13d [Sinorhizobium fredii NGR234]|uniref:Transposase for insertion sequence NGRIS-13d n=1 Tax=Sinorhizobium fredii (strain NBRC 101917 / NGR234) TaxID=394 RepID=C3M8X8_SINFN|nr:IS110 family transposase [Sinorhizobium fredii]ACP24349.1 putative transposase for insertion sequence NGRIS-13i [Sinorhizobium fredii NGR234]ACP26689.1 putative transposase for insertion sequence NGRIS-13d [Sinorhizobium fredii NGR234]
MTDQKQFYAGVDWASESHHVFLTDGDGRKIGERVFRHGGEGLAELAAWLTATSGATEAGQIQVAIEVPHGPVVETLIERGCQVHAINPKQMDRFRDRFTLAGAKDDSRDAEVMASALRTDRRCFRLLAAADPVVIELREWSRMAEDLGAERNRLTNRMREQLWRYFPALLELENDLGAEWLLDLWEAVPTPAKAARIRAATIAKLLKRNRIRRVDATHVLAVLRTPPVKVAAGTTEAASAHIATLIARIRLVNRQLKQAHQRLDTLTARLVPTEATEPGQRKQHDVEILASLPGVGRIVLATLLAEAFDALQRRDHAALRSLTGVAPVTKRSGKSCIVIRRQACHDRLANAMYHWARVAIQHDSRSRLKYAALRSRGHSHGRALRSVADRLLNVACAMLKTGTTFNPSLAEQKLSC